MLLFFRFFLALTTTTAASLVVAAAQASSSSSSSNEKNRYSFERFVETFDKRYDDPREYAKHEAIFYYNLAMIEQHNNNNNNNNNNNEGAKQQHGYSLGVNQYSDLLLSEIPMGYVKKTTHYHGQNVAATERSLLHHNNKNNVFDLEEIITTEPVSNLPKEINWKTQGVSTPIKNQYYCGSCWAFASTAVIESHVAIATGTLYSLSEQELVSCAPNPLHCGGTGGCQGSTAEIAMEYARLNGMVDEWAFGYESAHGAKVECSLTDKSSSSLRGAVNDDPHLKGAVAGIHAWAKLPRNNYTAVMNAVAKIGPLAVSVACNPWVSYKSGVYSGSLKSPKETDMNHLVVLEGYGTDKETGEDYWLIRNSWGPRWGEAGYIRLKRVDPDTLDDPDLDCGIDVSPADGVACTIDDNGNPFRPPDEKICGNSGLLYDVTLPLGAYLI